MNKLPLPGAVVRVNGTRYRPDTYPAHMRARGEQGTVLETELFDSEVMVYVIFPVEIPHHGNHEWFYLSELDS